MALLKIGALAERTGTSVPTIRYYEEIGLLPRARRGDSGQRQYCEDDVRRLDFVRRCRQFEFTIHDARLLAALARDAERPCAAARELALGNLAAVRARIDELKGLEAGLVELAESCDAVCATGCGADCAMLSDLST